ncbi:fungal-specific transcription factor domain-containing protein [Bisporella sp. PMI_857]|nr:fungal-specific transcription factor domain-containing protein [Bisporella sp. PMI_857]
MNTANFTAANTSGKKRKRLNFACNYCRSKKARCDEQKPACRACLLAGIECVTTDKRRPGVEVVRKTAGSPNHLATVTRASEPLVSGPARTSDESSTSIASPANSGTQIVTPEWELHSNALTRDRDGSHRKQSTIGQDVQRPFSGPLPMLPRIRGHNTQEILTGWLALAFYRLGIPCNFNSTLGLESDHPPAPFPTLALPHIPLLQICNEIADSYFDSINRIYPILDRATVKETFDDIAVLGVTGYVQPGTLSRLLIAYLVLALGSHDDNGTSESGELASAYISFCETMLGNVISWASLEAVQIIFMLSMSLRLRDRIASAWPIMGLCVSMAQSLGLNRRRVSTRRSPEGIDDQTENARWRTWWSVYSYEKLFAFELGRPSTIKDIECDQLDPDPVRNIDGDPNFPHIVISLARTLSQISRMSIRVRNQEEMADHNNLEDAIKEKVNTSGETVLLLMHWADGLPEGFRPRSDLICNPSQFPVASFISIQFHSALIMIMRNSFLVSEEATRMAVQQYVTGKPWDFLIRNGQTLAANSARSIIKLLIEGHDRGSAPVASTPAAPLQALYVLSVHLITHPTSRLSNTDLTLIHNAADFARAQYEKFTSNRKLHHVLQVLDQRVNHIISAAKSQAAQQSSVSQGARNSETSPSSVHSVENRTFNVETAPSFMTVPQAQQSALVDSTAIPLGDVAWSPSLADEIGWDWGDFSQLFNEGLDHLPC